MYPVSERFRRALKKSHTPIFRLDILRAGMDDEVLVDDERLALKLLAGSSVTFAGDDDVRGRARLTVLDPAKVLTPDLAQDVLSPFTAELAPWRGIRFDDGVEELVPLGRFKVEDFEVNEREGGPLFELTLYDLSIESDSPLEKPWPIDAGTPVERAIVDLLLAAYPLYRFRLGNTGRVTPSLVLPGDASPWGEARELARSAGYELYVDREGYVTMSPARLEAANEATWVHDEAALPDFADLSFRVTRDVVNTVQVVGTSSQNTAAVFGEVYDNDPTSVTYVGTIGPKVYKHESPIVRSNEQATQMAAAILGRKLGPGRLLSCRLVPNPAADAWDTFRFTRSRLGVDGNVLAVTLEIPLDAEGDMTGTFRHSILTGDRLAA